MVQDLRKSPTAVLAVGRTGNWLFFGAGELARALLDGWID